MSTNIMEAFNENAKRFNFDTDDIIIKTPKKERIKPKDEEFTEFVTIESADKSISVATPIAMQCPLFKAMLTSSFAEGLTQTISLKQFPSIAVQIVIEVS
jgi:hypothetical protein